MKHGELGGGEVWQPPGSRFTVVPWRADLSGDAGKWMPFESELSAYVYAHVGTVADGDWVLEGIRKRISDTPLQRGGYYKKFVLTLMEDRLSSDQRRMPAAGAGIRCTALDKSTSIRA